MKRILFVVCLLLSRTHTWSSERVESKDLTGHVDFQPGTPQDSLSVLLITMEEAGHSIPMLSLGEALVEKGHKVTLLAVETKLPASNSTMTNLRAWCRERSILFVSAGVVTWNVPTKEEDLGGGLQKLMSFMAKTTALFEGLRDNTLEALLKDERKLLRSSNVVVLDLFFSTVQEWLNENTDLTILSLTLPIPFYTNSLPSWYYPTFPLNPDAPPNPSFIWIDFTISLCLVSGD